MYLFLMQHAESKSIEEDPERSITDRGKEKTASVSAKLKSLNLNIDEIWHSTKKRSRETAEILTSLNNLKNQISEKDFLSPMDEVKPAVKVLNTFNKNLMIVGHLPFLTKLVSSLITGSENFEPVKFVNSAILVLIKENDKWKIISLITP